jgi:hypothetical protein
VGPGDSYAFGFCMLLLELLLLLLLAAQRWHNKNIYLYLASSKEVREIFLFWLFLQSTIFYFDVLLLFFFPLSCSSSFVAPVGHSLRLGHPSF